MDDLTFWLLARITGLTAFAVLSIAVLSGEALRTSVLDLLASNRALRKLLLGVGALGLLFWLVRRRA